MKKNKKLILLFVLFILIASFIINISIGAFDISFTEIINTLLKPDENMINHKVLFDIRIPRILLGLLVGIAFGVSGTMMQTLFRNPLADPSIIGVSAGASAGVVLFMMLGSYLPLIFTQGTLSYFSLPLSAFFGAIITIAAIYKLATIYNKVAVTIMLLAGIAINSLLGALIGLFSYVSTDEELRSFTFWTMGSLANGEMLNIMVIFPIVLFVCFFAMNKKVELNLLLLGEEEAKNVGVNTERLKKQIIVCVSLAIGASVAFCGIIGFVGLVVPHISRAIVGSNHKYLLPLSALLGAFILIWADAIARSIISPAELPIGIITAILGAPFFLFLLMKNKQNTLI